MSPQELAAHAATLLLQYLAFVERQGGDAGFRTLPLPELEQLRREALSLRLIRKDGDHLRLTDKGQRAIDMISMASYAVPLTPLVLTPQDRLSRQA